MTQEQTNHTVTAFITERRNLVAGRTTNNAFHFCSWFYKNGLKLLGFGSILMLSACSPNTDTPGEPDIGAAIDQQLSSNSNSSELPSYAIASNTVDPDFEFAQFRSRTILINSVSELERFSPGTTFAKLSSGSATYYLGAINPRSPLELPMSIPHQIKEVDFEVFSSVPGTAAYTRTIEIQ